MGARLRLPDSLKGLLRRELAQAVEEACLSPRDREIARLCLVERWAQADIAAQVYCHRSTVSKRMPGILAQVELAAARIRPAESFT